MDDIETRATVLTLELLQNSNSPIINTHVKKAIACVKALPEVQAKYEQCAADYDTRMQHIVQLEGELHLLRRFAADIMNGWPWLDTLDPLDVQDIAAAAGVLQEHLRTEPCAENCNCAEEVGEFPLTCYTLKPEYSPAAFKKSPDPSKQI